ncbi:hypothetical protein Tco_0467706 [Tanacetum coccineum]
MLKTNTEVDNNIGHGVLWSHPYGKESQVLGLFPTGRRPSIRIASLRGESQVSIASLWGESQVSFDIESIGRVEVSCRENGFSRMDDPNLTIEEYIRLEEEKALKREKVFNWQTATYGKIRVDDDLHNLSSVEAEFPAIVINDAVAPQDELQCKS